MIVGRKNRVLLSYYFIAILASLLPPTTSALKTRLTWVNGIGYNEHHIKLEGNKISDIFGTKCWYCLNPTAMANEKDVLGYLNDLTQAGSQKLGRITEEVNALVQHLKDAVSSVGKDGFVIHIAHSQGALLTFLASKQLSPLEMNRIEVIAFGGAAVIQRTSTTPFRRCINYYSVNDPLLWVVPSAEQALRSGLVDGESEFCFLAPRIGDPIQDHYLLAPTYAQALKWEAKRYRETYQSITYRVTKATMLLTVSFCNLVLLWLTSIVHRLLNTVFVQLCRRYLYIAMMMILKGLQTRREPASYQRDNDELMVVQEH